MSVAVLGNHDHWVGEATVREILQQSDIVDLSNDVYTLHRGDATLHFAGVDSVTLHKHRLDVVLSKLPPPAPAILLAHEPDFADVSATTGRFSLQISGHSHGGQFIIPGIGTLVKRLTLRNTHWVDIKSATWSITRVVVLEPMSSGYGLTVHLRSQFLL